MLLRFIGFVVLSPDPEHAERFENPSGSAGRPHVLLGVIPFVIIEAIVIICFCIRPELALWLPNKMIGWKWFF